MDIFERKPFKVRMIKTRANYLDCLAKRENIEAVGVYHIRGMLISFLTGNITAILILAFEKMNEINFRKILKKASLTIGYFIIRIFYYLKCLFPNAHVNFN
jgi:hypothetical protein